MKPIHTLSLSAAFVFLMISFAAAAFSAQATHNQDSPEGLAHLWIDAIKTNSIKQIKPLIHPSCLPKDIKQDTLDRMISGVLPPEVKVVTIELGSKPMLSNVYMVVPDKQLSLEYVSHSKADRTKYGIGKGFPIARYESKWFFVVCTK